jgi:hypothetical protein
MEHTMLNANLMEVRGATSELAARLYAEEVTGRSVERTVYVVHSVYQVALR